MENAFLMVKHLVVGKQLGGKSDFKVENGMIVGTTVANTGNTFLATVNDYSDFILELDFKIDDTANNSGIQTRSHFDASGNDGLGMIYGRQVEIDPSSRKWCGGIYDEARRGWLYPLTLNPGAQLSFKPNEFNHIRIEAIGNETKTWVNGKATAYVVDTIDKEGFIALQVHSNKEDKAGIKVYFKNVKIKTGKLKPLPFEKNIFVVNHSPNELSKYEKENGWKLLFDGKTPEGWKSARGENFPDKGWKIENGADHSTRFQMGRKVPMAEILSQKINSAVLISPSGSSFLQVLTAVSNTL